MCALPHYSYICLCRLTPAFPFVTHSINLMLRFTISFALYVLAGFVLVEAGTRYVEHTVAPMLERPTQVR